MNARLQKIWDRRKDVTIVALSTTVVALFAALARKERQLAEHDALFGRTMGAVEAGWSPQINWDTKRIKMIPPGKGE